MPQIIQTLVWLSILWAAAALAVQVIMAGRGGRRDFSRRAGDPGRGVIYNFTTAMTPTRKEAARRHPAEFATGMVFHAGTIMALASVPVLLLSPTIGSGMVAFCRPLFAVSFIAGLVLFVRRLASRNLRLMSAPDDYVAILVTCGLLVFVFYSRPGFQGQIPLMVYAAMLFVYLPIGKLRHIAFFFAARADLGYRLGHRGVYPLDRLKPER